MNIKIKKILLLIMLSTSTSFLFANFETWLGLSLTGNTYTPDKIYKKFYSTYTSPNTEISLEELDGINEMGPSFDIILFPYYEIPLGIKLSNSFTFPIGINSSTVFRSVQGDIHYRLKSGIDYAQVYNATFGMFLSFGFEYDFFRISKTNQRNTISKSEYHKYESYGLYGEIGLLTTIDKGYFKFGIDYYHSIKESSYSHSLIFAGGVRL